MYNRSHKEALRRVALRQKATIARMRVAQRSQQRKLEESTVDDEDADVNSQFCLLCRLNYRSTKTTDHQHSESHRRMKTFLMPFCEDCRITFKSPMEYETHRCSLDHIKVQERRWFFFLIYFNVTLPDKTYRENISKTRSTSWLQPPLMTKNVKLIWNNS